MQAIVVYDRTRYANNQWLAQQYCVQGAARGIRTTMVFVEELDAYLRTHEPPQFAIMRCENQQARQQLEALGTHTSNSARASWLCNDKMRTLTHARELGARTLRTSKFAVHELFDAVSYPVVIKPLDGHGGFAVAHIHNAAELTEYLQTYQFAPDTELLCQEVADVIGKDLRVYVLGDRILAAMLRHAPGQFLSNFTRGGTATRVELSAADHAMVLELAQGFGTDFAGFDFFPSPTGLILNEVEDIVGMRMLYAHTTIDPVAEHLRYLHETYGATRLL